MTMTHEEQLKNLEFQKAEVAAKIVVLQNDLWEIELAIKLLKSGHVKGD